MTKDWKRLAAAIRDARKALGWGQQKLADAAGVGFSTVQRLEGGVGYKKMPLTIDKVERALGWAPGSAEGVLAGGDPVALSEPEAGTGEAAVGATEDAAGRFVSGLPARIQHELAGGELVETDVIELNRPGMRLIVFATRDPDQSPEGKAGVTEDIKEWTRVQRRLRGLTADEPPTST
ncbi:helix-turn-helix domain-containing protein [Streptomyces sp. NPDC101112]|uniref:helix-turn-helix domain-containing protein n=1 Tax=Streptomyces sp. NPDC101112 TaxID=3366105 RepID=UPI00381E5BDE